MLIEKEGIRALPNYSVSKTIEEVCDEYGLTEAVYLASNENPLGCSRAVTDVVRNAADLHRYPDGDGRHLKAALAAHLNRHCDHIFLGNGSNEVLECAAKAFVADQDEVLISAHSFAMYPILGRLFGGKVVEVPMNHWRVDLDAMADAVSSKTKLIYLSNINNPTGVALNRPEFQSFMTQVPDTALVVVDEAYIEFSQPNQSFLADVDNWPNLLISRTFSKAYGLAGFRVGYGLASKAIVAILEKVRQPFNINALALKAAVAAVQDQTFIQRTVQHTQLQRQALVPFLEQNNFQVLPSEANFICYKPGAEAGEHYHFLLSQGVIVRPLKSYGMHEWLRVSIGTESENQAFVDAVKQWKANQYE
ncbi:MAG: histidinol-phosphate transaminase [Reinekea sp.]|jgi:histidinol-phosphate aminotransferase